MQFNKVSICGIDTSKLKTLSEKEKTEFLKQAHSGDTFARDALICGNLKLVLSAVQRFSSRRENPDDLFQVGCVGLIKAIDNFDTSLDVRFSTYAVPMIQGEIRRYLRDNNSLRVSRSVRDTAYHAMRAKEELQKIMQREPTVDEIAAKLGIKRAQVVSALESIVEPVSLYEPVYSDGGDTIYVVDQVSDKNDDRNWIDEINLKQSVSALSDREKRILSSRFLSGKTQTEVAEEIGISQAQISRLEKNAIAKITE